MGAALPAFRLCGLSGRGHWGGDTPAPAPPRTPVALQPVSPARVPGIRDAGGAAPPFWLENPTLALVFLVWVSPGTSSLLRF